MSEIYSKKLKILIFNRWVGYNEGGNETHIKDLIEWFSKNGHEISAITTSGDTLEKFNTVKKHYISAPKGYYSYGSLGLVYALLFLFKSFLKFTSLFLKGERYDVISVHFSLEAFLARKVKLFFGIP